MFVSIETSANLTQAGDGTGMCPNKYTKIA